MSRRALLCRPGRRARRAGPRTLIASAPLLVWASLVCLLLLAPASALAVTADAYEPDGTYVTASPITVGAATQQHTTFPEGDEDWVSFTVSAGLTYVIETGPGTPAEYCDTFLYLYDADGTTEIDANNDTDYIDPFSRIVYTADADKTVYARVYEAWDSEGAYAISVVRIGDSYEPDGSPGLATPITVGGAAQQHTIEPEGDEDWVTFAVSAGLTYEVATAPGSSPEVLEGTLELFDSDGTTELSYGDGLYYDETSWIDGGTTIVYTADANETLYARVAGYWFSHTGGYAISVVRIGDSFEPDGSSVAATPIAVNGATQQRTLVPANDEDWVSIAVLPGWRYTVVTSAGLPSEATETSLELYDADGTTLIAGDDGSAAYASLVYTADAAENVYGRVTASSSGSGGTTYALRVTGVAIPRIDVPAMVDFGDVSVGTSLDRTVMVTNTGAASLSVNSVQLQGAGFTIVRDDATGESIPPGESREVVVRYAPTIAYSGAPAAVKHVWTTELVEYNYVGGVLYSYWLYSGFQNTGGEGDLDWRVSVAGLQSTGTGAVVAGGRYTVRVTISAGAPSSTGLVELLQPVSDSWDFESGLGSLVGVAYIRVPEGALTIASNDDDRPSASVDLVGSGVPDAVTDTTPPTTTDDADSAWHRDAVTVHLTPVDTGGSGMVGGQAKTEYSKDGGATWVNGTSAIYGVSAKRGGGSGLHTLLYRSTDAAGNLEATKSCEVKIDARAPQTANDAPIAPRTGPVTVHLTAADSLFGVSACSGVASVSCSLDGGAPQTVPGAAASVIVSGAGTHWIAYCATDVAGNVEYVKLCSVTIVPGAPAKGSPRGSVRRSSLPR